MDPLVIVSRAVDLARKNGARGVEALLVQDTKMSLSGVDAPTAVTQQKSSVSLELTLFREGGRAAKRTLKPQSLEAIARLLPNAIAATLDAAASAPEDPLAGPCEPLDVTPSGLGLFDRRHTYIDMEARLATLADNARSCTKIDPRIRVERISYSEHVQQRTLATSRGLTLHEHSTRFQTTCEARIEGNDTSLCHGVESRQFADAASLPLGAQLAHQLLRMSQQTTLPSTDLPCVISGPVLCQILRSLSNAFVAGTVRNGRSFLATQSDQPIANELLHVVDDPTAPGGLYSRVFDDHGVIPVPVVLIKEGQPNAMLYDLATARIDDVRPTGHELRGVTTPSNLTIRPGTRSRNAMHMALENYLAIERLHGFHPLRTRGIVNPKTGRIRCVADVTVFKNREAVGTALVSLNLHIRELLNPIIEIAGDQSRSCGVDGCTVLLERFPGDA
jgi:predicted Zn-dependent protease